MICLNSFLKISLVVFLLLSIGVNAQTTLYKVYFANMVVEYPKEILTEKGWTSYVTFSVNNTGDSDIYKLKASIEGDFPKWFDISNDNISILQVGEKSDFLAKLSVPYEVRTGDYNFSIKLESSEINYKADFKVRVFDSKQDLLLYQVKSLKDDLSELEKEADANETSGLNLSSAREDLYQIASELNAVEDQILKNTFDQVTNQIKDVENLFIKARFDISNPPPVEEKQASTIDISPSDIVLLSSGIVIVILTASLIYLIRKVKIQSRVRLSNLNVKDLVIDNRKLKDLEQEIEKIRESQQTIEQEFRGNIVSKESYDELRLKYQEKLMELESQRKKIRGY